MTPRRAPQKQKIDWAAINFAFVLVSTILIAAMAYAAFSASAASRIDRLERDVDQLQAAVREIQSERNRGGAK